MNSLLKTVQKGTLADVLERIRTEPIVQGNGLLHAIVQRQDDESSILQIIHALEKRGSNANEIDRMDQTGLFYASRDGKCEVIRHLIARGCDVNMLDSLRQSALFYAANGGHLEACEILLSSGADPDPIDNHRQTPLHYAANEGHRSVCELLLKQNTTKALRYDNEYFTPADRAAQNHHLELVEIIASCEDEESDEPDLDRMKCQLMMKDLNGEDVQLNIHMLELISKACPHAWTCAPPLRQHWKDIARELIKYISKHKEAGIFMHRVDPVKHGCTDYFDIIDNPMDFGLIRTKLNDGEYSDGITFLRDIDLVFSNCKTYNDEGSQVNEMGKRVEKYVREQITNLSLLETIMKGDDTAAEGAWSPVPKRRPRQSRIVTPPTQKMNLRPRRSVKPRTPSPKPVPMILRFKVPPKPESDIPAGPCDDQPEMEESHKESRGRSAKKPEPKKSVKKGRKIDIKKGRRSSKVVASDHSDEEKTEGEKLHDEQKPKRGRRKSKEVDEGDKSPVEESHELQKEGEVIGTTEKVHSDQEQQGHSDQQKPKAEKEMREDLKKRKSRSQGDAPRKGKVVGVIEDSESEKPKKRLRRKSDKKEEVEEKADVDSDFEVKKGKSRRKQTDTPVDEQLSSKEVAKSIESENALSRPGVIKLEKVDEARKTRLRRMAEEAAEARRLADEADKARQKSPEQSPLTSQDNTKEPSLVARISPQRKVKKRIRKIAKLLSDSDESPGPGKRLKVDKSPYHSIASPINPLPKVELSAALNSLQSPLVRPSHPPRPVARPQQTPGGKQMEYQKNLGSHRHSGTDVRKSEGLNMHPSMTRLDRSNTKSTAPGQAQGQRSAMVGGKNRPAQTPGLRPNPSLQRPGQAPGTLQRPGQTPGSRPGFNRRPNPDRRTSQPTSRPLALLGSRSPAKCLSKVTIPSRRLSPKAPLVEGLNIAELLASAPSFTIDTKEHEIKEEDERRKKEEQKDEEKDEVNSAASSPVRVELPRSAIPARKPQLGLPQAPRVLSPPKFSSPPRSPMLPPPPDLLPPPPVENKIDRKMGTKNDTSVDQEADTPPLGPSSPADTIFDSDESSSDEEDSSESPADMPVPPPPPVPSPPVPSPPVPSPLDSNGMGQQSVSSMSSMGMMPQTTQNQMMDHIAVPMTTAMGSQGMTQMQMSNMVYNDQMGQLQMGVQQMNQMGQMQVVVPGQVMQNGMYDQSMMNYDVSMQYPVYQQMQYQQPVYQQIQPMQMQQYNQFGQMQFVQQYEYEDQFNQGSYPGQ